MRLALLNNLGRSGRAGEREQQTMRGGMQRLGCDQVAISPSR